MKQRMWEGRGTRRSDQQEGPDSGGEFLMCVCVVEEVCPGGDHHNCLISEDEFSEEKRVCPAGGALDCLILTYVSDLHAA